MADGKPVTHRMVADVKVNGLAPDTITSLVADAVREANDPAQAEAAGLHRMDKGKLFASLVMAKFDKALGANVVDEVAESKGFDRTMRWRWRKGRHAMGTGSLVNLAAGLMCVTVDVSCDVVAVPDGEG